MMLSFLAVVVAVVNDYLELAFINIGKCNRMQSTECSIHFNTSIKGDVPNQLA